MKLARLAPVALILGLTVACSGSTPRAHVLPVPAADPSPTVPALLGTQRLVGFERVALVVPKTWLFQEPNCSQPRGPGYVSFYSTGSYFCPLLKLPFGPRPPSVELGAATAALVSPEQLGAVTQINGLSVRRTTMSCSLDRCDQSLVVGSVLISVTAPTRGLETALVEQLAASLRPMPSDEVAVPFSDQGAARSVALRALARAGLRAVTSGHSGGRSYDHAVPSPGSVVPAGSVVTITWTRQ